MFSRARARLERAELGYWRSATGEEVDFVIEADGRLLQVEVKAMARPRLSDAAHLRSFMPEYGKKARRGILLHTGETSEWLAPDVLAIPWCGDVFCNMAPLRNSWVQTGT